MSITEVPPAQSFSGLSLSELLRLKLTEVESNILVGVDQPLVRAVRRAVREKDEDALVLAYGGVTDRHLKVPTSVGGRVRPGPLDAPPGGGTSTFSFALRALAALGLSLIVVDDDRAREFLSYTEKWLSESGLCLPGEDPGTGSSRPADVDAVLRTLAVPEGHRIARLTTPATLDDPVRTTAWLWLLDLAGLLPAGRPGPACGVLFDLGSGGQRGNLSLSVLPGLPPILAPDPAVMLLSSANKVFRQSLGDVWFVSARFPGAVLWSVTANNRPMMRMTGPSISGAFAVLYRELHRRMPALRRVRRPHTHIVGAVNRMRPDRLGPVEGYPGKFSVVTRRDRVIYPAEDRKTVQQIVRDRNLRTPIPCATIAQAGRRSRLPQQRHVFMVLIPLLVISVSVAGYLWFLQGRTSKNLELSQVGDAAKALQVRATVTRDSDPENAIRLSAAAVALAPANPVTHANLVGLIQDTRFRGTLAPGEATGFTEDIQTGADGKVMITSTGQQTVIWTGDGSRNFTPRGRIPLSGEGEPALSPDGKLIAVPSETTKLFDISDPDRPRPVGRVDTGVSAPVVFSPDGNRLVVAGNPPRSWRVTDPSRPVLIGTPDRSPGSGAGPAIAACPGSDVVAVADGTSARLFRVTAHGDPDRLGDVGRPGTSSNPSIENIVALACSEDGLLVTGTAGQIGVGDIDGTVTAWDITDPENPSPGTVLEGGRGEVRSLTVRGRYVAASGDDGTRIASLQSFSRKVSITGIATVAGRGGTAFSPDGSTLFTGLPDNSSAGLARWNAFDDNDFTQNVDGEAAFALSTALSGDLLAVAQDAYEPQVNLFRTGSQGRLTLLSTVTLPRTPVDGTTTRTALSPDRRTLAATLAGGGIGLWNLDDLRHPRPTGRLPGDGETGSLAFTADPHVLIALDTNGEVAVWDVTDPANPRPSATLSAYSGTSQDGSSWPGPGLAVSPAAPVMATVSPEGSIVKLWRTNDPRRPELAKTLELPQVQADGTASAPTLALSPDGTRMITDNGQDGLKLWRIEDLDDPEGSVITSSALNGQAVFGPGRQLVATTDDRWGIQLWDLDDPGHPVSLRSLTPGLRGHSPMSGMLFAPGGDVLYVAGESLYGLRIADDVRLSTDPLEYACGIVGTGPGRAEWAAVTDIGWREVCS